jgi:hypothetical protein
MSGFDEVSFSVTLLDKTCIGADGGSAGEISQCPFINEIHAKEQQ